mgnify:CR=1 FL=1
MDFNKLISKYKENIGEIKDSEELLKIEKYNPWTSENVEDLSSKFLDALENDYRDFSWLNIEEGLFELESNQYKNLHYGIPNHVQGNIDISTLFLCLVNPNIALEDKKSNMDVYSYFKKAKDINSEDSSLNILGEKEEDLKKVLNVVEFVKFIISHYKLAKKTDNIFSYKYNQIDTIMNECLQSDLASLKNINSPDIDIARKKIIEYSNNPLSFFHYNFQGEEIKIINTERFNFKVYNLFLLNSINYEKLRELFQITKLEFDKNGNTILGMILSKDLIFETEDKKELDRSKLEYLILNNSLDIYKYPNNNSKEYLKVLNFKEENPNNYLAVTEFIKANKTVYNLEIFIKLNIKEI